MEINEVEYESIKEGVGFVSNDENIIDYISEHKNGIEILRSFDKKIENTGVALLFDKDDYKDIVLLIRIKKLEHSSEDNGLIMFVIFNSFKNKRGLEMLKEIIEESFTDGSFKEKIFKDLEELTLKSIVANA